MLKWERRRPRISEFLFTLSAAALAAVLSPMGVAAAVPPVVDSFTATPTVVLPGGGVTLTVNAHDPDCTSACTTGCGQYIRYDMTTWSATGGTLTPSNGASGSPYTATALWQAPAVEGTYTVTVTLYDSGTYLCGGRQSTAASLPIQVSSGPANAPPVFESLTATPATLSPAQTATLAATASDPDGDALTYAWSTDLGSVTVSGVGMAVFQAPATPGTATVTCTTTDSRGASASKTVAITVTGVFADRSVVGGFVTPLRVASNSGDLLYVADPRIGGILLLSGTDDSPRGRLPVPGITALAVDWADRLLVGTTFGARVMDASGHPVVVLNPSEDLGPVTDVAVDSVGRRYLVLYGQTGRAVAFGEAGDKLFTFGANGDGVGEAKGASAIAVQTDGSILVGDSGHGLIHVFSASGVYVSSFGGLGGGGGQFTQLQGLAVDADGIIYGTDAFQSRLQTFNPDHTFRESVGSFGDGVGQLMTPTGLCVRPGAKELVVCSLNASRLQVYRLERTPGTDRPPTAPQPADPADGATLVQGQPVVLTVVNASDPEGRPLQYAYELSREVSGTGQLVKSWMVLEGTSGVTQAEATTFAQEVGSYLWKCRAFDGALFSEWSATQHFGVTAAPPQNHAPSVPLPIVPVTGEEASTLTPALRLANATDPDGDTLTYQFQLALFAQGALWGLADSGPVASGPSYTDWAVPAGLLEPSQKIYWRCRASDGRLAGAWSDYAAFWTPPFALPQEGAVGDIPGGDRTRPDEVRFTLDARSAGLTLYFLAYDIQSADQITLEVNGDHPHPIPAQVAGDWSGLVMVEIPASELRDDIPNRVKFVNAASGDPWGVKKVTLEPPQDIPFLKAQAFNTVVDVSWAGRPEAPWTTLRLLRSESPSGPFATVGDYPSGRGLVRDVGLANGKVYYYRAAFVSSSAVVGTASPVISAAPTASGVTPITDLRVERSGQDLVLTWTPVTSEPVLQRVELYSDTFGQWLPDTVRLKNQIGSVSPLDGQFLYKNGAVKGGDTWYKGLPVDMNGTRATP